MHLMLQHSTASDFVLATGRTWSVRDFASAAFAAAGMSLEWRGSGLKQEGIEARSGKLRVSVDPQFFRPAEVDQLLGSPARAKSLLGWTPETSVEKLAQLMVEADIRRNERGLSF
jgi:GDPmannose 4,6-dehydratase